MGPKLRHATVLGYDVTVIDTCSRPGAGMRANFSSVEVLKLAAGECLKIILGIYIVLVRFCISYDNFF
jgi:hypothetical protein